MSLAVRAHKYLSVLVVIAISIQQAAASCTLTAQGVRFGPYDALSISPAESTGAVEVTCTVPTSYQLSLSSGNGVFTERTMVNGSHTLIYNLYTDASYSFIWGDGTGVTQVVNGYTESTTIHDIFGRIPANQDVAVGSYNDFIVVTIEF
ncbi:spore coat U domain-containing protein [Pseudidiomarina sp.]|uniref:Csu type fimbrial protein n=1 Tax=Pseudidiomarina sp. TaxID=2081707 RepID=UPI003A9712E0